MAILAVNAGSSSLKFLCTRSQHGGKVQPSVLNGCIEGLEPGGTPSMDWSFAGQRHQEVISTPGESSFQRALARLRALLAELEGAPTIKAVAHRVVHGGQAFKHSVVVDTTVLAQLERLNSMAPLHQPHNLAGIRSFQQAFPQLPQVACFDTAFHTSLPEVASAFALPQSLTEQGVRRYGFHGLSYHYITDTLLEQSPRAKGRVLMAHLGNGASLCAAVQGRSTATTMGFSALDGLMMGTRSGTLDAGVLLYLMEQGWDHDRIQKLLYKQSGLLGVSGISADMRRLRADGSAGAQRAIEQFTYRVVREAGALIASMGGLDVLAFSGGIGEHDAVLRAEVCQRLGWLGVQIDEQRNGQATRDAISAIHTPGSSIEVWVIPTDEGRVAAREAAALLHQGDDELETEPALEAVDNPASLPNIGALCPDFFGAMPENTPMPDSLELIVAYAATSDPTCQASLQHLALPHLERLLARLSATPQPLVQAKHQSHAPPLSLPHERVWAQALGLPDNNGHIPWGAWQAQQQGLVHPANHSSAWAVLTPCHWQVGTDHITLNDPAQLQLTLPDAHALLEIVSPWLAQDGLQLQLDSPGRWLMQGPLLADLPMPSLERVQGQDVRHWMQHQAQNQHISTSQRRAMQVWQRLHSELQMLLYTHPLNEARQARGLPPVNAFWLHGAGCLPTSWHAATASVQCLHDLQASAHNGDWQTWASAWQAIDAGPMAHMLEHVQAGGIARLSLCSEGTALTWHSSARTLGQRLAQFSGLFL